MKKERKKERLKNEKMTEKLKMKERTKEWKKTKKKKEQIFLKVKRINNGDLACDINSAIKRVMFETKTKADLRQTGLNKVDSGQNPEKQSIQFYTELN